MNNQIRVERQEVVNLIIHFKGQGMAFRTIAPIINEIGFLSITGRKFDPSVLNKIWRNTDAYLSAKDIEKAKDIKITKLEELNRNNKFCVTSLGDFVIRNEVLKKVLFRSDCYLKTIEKYKEIQTA